MANSIDSLKTSIFSHLKSYGNMIQGVFEEHVARPILSLTHDNNRSSSVQKSIMKCKNTVALSKNEKNDNETNNSMKTIFSSMKNTFLLSTKRRISEIDSTDNKTKHSREHRHSSVTCVSNKINRTDRVQHRKSVSFSDKIHYSSENNIDVLRNPDNMIDYELVMTSIDEKTIDISYQLNFPSFIRPRRISMSNSKDLVYQDLSTEIVTYVLRHALRSLEKEVEDLLEENKKLYQNK